MWNGKTHFPMLRTSMSNRSTRCVPARDPPDQCRTESCGDVLTCSHRDGASHEPRDARNQNVILSCGYSGNSHDQACSRNNVVDGPPWTAALSPPNSIGEAVLRMLAKTAHFFSPDATSSPEKCSGAYKRRHHPPMCGLSHKQTIRSVPPKSSQRIEDHRYVDRLLQQRALNWCKIA